MTRPGIEPWSPEPLANTLTARPMSGKNYLIIYNAWNHLDVSKQLINVELLLLDSNTWNNLTV